jgi:hypothetical protein
MPASPKITNIPLSDYRVKTTLNSDSTHTQHVIMASGLVPAAYDFISLTYTGNDLTGVVYKLGGAAGTTQATLTLTYSSGVLQSVTKT